MKRKALGRGLSALLSEPSTVSEPTAVEVPPFETQHEADHRLRDIPIDALVPNSRQPRQIFDTAALRELSESIKIHGILQPLAARSVSGDSERYELIAGERRLRAAKIAGLDQVPVIILDADESASLELALVENLQRADLDPVEEASAFQMLIRDFTMTQEEVAERVGRSRAAVANAVRLLHLSDSVQQMVASGELSPGHARTLLVLDDFAEQFAMAQEIARRGLSVRQTERLLQDRKSSKTNKKKGSEPKPPHQDIHIADLERRLQQALKTRVQLRRDPSGRGVLEIQFYDDAHLTTILRHLKVATDT